MPSPTLTKEKRGRNSVVECLLPKQKVASSNLVARSSYSPIGTQIFFT